MQNYIIVGAYTPTPVAKVCQWHASEPGLFFINRLLYRRIFLHPNRAAKQRAASWGYTEKRQGWHDARQLLTGTIVRER
jgi:hypothetical protein